MKPSSGQLSRLWTGFRSALDAEPKSRQDGDEYSVVSFEPSWGLLSLAIFLVSLPLRFWARWLPWHPRQYYYQPGLMMLSIFGLAVVGMLVAWLGWRGGRRRPLAQWGLLLNGVVAGLVVLLVAGLIVYWRFLR